MNKANKPKVSIIVPAYNEEEGIKICFNKLKLETKKHKDFNFEFIFIDNNSEDKTFKILEQIAKNHRNFRACKLSKNFGYQRSIWTGYNLCKGDIAIQFDSDLQDPPHLLGKFLENWKKGFKIVYGIRIKRSENFLINFLRKSYYRLLNYFSQEEIKVDVGDFYLIDRLIINEIKKVKDPQIYIRGLIFQLGFKSIGVKYKRDARQFGKSKFDFLSLLKLAADGFFSQTIAPLKFFTISGIIILISSFILIFYYLISYLNNQYTPSGFTTLIIILLFNTGFLSLGIGVLGEYLSRIYNILKFKPMSLIEKDTDELK